MLASDPSLLEARPVSPSTASTATPLISSFDTVIESMSGATVDLMDSYAANSNVIK